MGRGEGDIAGPLITRRLLLLGGAAVTAGAAALIVDSLTQPPARVCLGADCSSRPPTGAVVPDVAADGVTDDRTAIQRALDQAPGDRPWTVWLPGLCSIGSGGQSSGAPFGLVIRRSQVTITGAQGAGLVSHVPGTRLLLVSGVDSPANDPLNLDGWITSSPVLPFAEAVDQGVTQVALRKAADAATLHPGDVVFLRTGQLTASVMGREPDAELNEVRAVSGTHVTLTYPTAKPYLRERMTSDPSGVSHVGGHGRPTPWGLSPASARVVRDVTVRGLRLIASSRSSTATALRIQQAWGVVVSDCDIAFGKWGIGGRYARDVKVSNTSLYTLGATDGDPAWIAPSTGCTEWLVQSCRGGGIAPAKIHAHEGIADLSIRDWRSQTPDGPGKAGGENVSVRGRAYRHVYDVDLTGAYTADNCAMARITDQVSGPRDQVQFRRLRLRGSPGLAFLSVESPAVTIYRTGLDLPPHARIELQNGARPFI